MGRSRNSRLLRTARLESMEDRLAMTAQPWATPESANLGDQTEWLGPVSDVRLEHHTVGDRLESDLCADPSASRPDFWLADESLDVAPDGLGGVQTAANDVHAATGVNYAFNHFGLTGAGQTVAIIDSGIAYDHVALGGGLGANYRVVGGWDFAENDANPYDDGPAGFHGTHVAGIVGNSNATYRGVAPGVDLVALRVFDDNNAGYFSWVEDALQWVHQHRNDYRNPITTVNLSIGMDWNADRVPEWANLEDEFTQLEADGIFVAVSAGNSFGSYRAPGLSYPAASPHVVPVASVDGNGELSSFSQRSSRVIAAPGRSIMSTVPDYLTGSDGVVNDFGAASGTSMASPYVAGAATLIRQAMTFAGYSNISQSTIYDHMWNTADVFLDSATNANYHRLNVQKAINALMPADEFGNSAAAATSLGSWNGSKAFTGAIGDRSDVDFVTFTAGQSGTAKLTVTSPDGLKTNVKVVGADATVSGDTLTFNVVAGQNYTLSIGSQNGIGHYAANLAMQSAPPAAPTNFTATATGLSEVSLSWSDSPDETDYWVYQWINGRSEYIAGLDANTTSYTVKGLSAGPQHFYIVAHNAYGRTGSGWQAVDVWALPTAPGDFHAKALSGSEVELTWTDSGYETDYWVYQWIDGQSQYIAGLDANTTNYTVKGLEAGAQHFYVVAHNAYGIVGSGWQHVELNAPSAPSLEVRATSATSVQLSWTAADRATEYWVYTWNGRSDYIMGLDGNVTTYQVTGLTPGTTQHFYLVAYNPVGRIGSGWQSVTLPNTVAQGPATVGPDGYAVTASFASERYGEMGPFSELETQANHTRGTSASSQMTLLASAEAKRSYFETMGQADASATIPVQLGAPAAVKGEPRAASKLAPLDSELLAAERLFESLGHEDLL